MFYGLKKLYSRFKLKGIEKEVFQYECLSDEQLIKEVGSLKIYPDKVDVLYFKAARCVLVETDDFDNHPIVARIKLLNRRIKKICSPELLHFVALRFHNLQSYIGKSIELEYSYDWRGYEWETIYGTLMDYNGIFPVTFKLDNCQVTCEAYRIGEAKKPCKDIAEVV